MASGGESRLCSIVGVVGDVHRHMEGHHYADKSCVFGLSREEVEAVQAAGLVTRPRQHTETQDRYQVLASPWSVMRVLAMKFGYEIPVMPIGGLINCDSGERRTCIFTVQKKFPPKMT